jgi:predicted Zn finger-like uncharacterized protein
MSLITRCPACTTVFKVVPDQLRVSEGWVRCGQCDEVFDANSNLQSSLVETLPVVTEVYSAQESLNSEPAAVVEQPYDWNQPEAVTTSQTEVPGDATPAVNMEVNEADSPSAPARQTPEVDDISPSAESDHLLDPLMSVSPGLEVVPASAIGETPHAISETNVTPEFMRSEYPLERPRGRFGILVALTGFVLTIALFVQIAMFERDRIAVAAPSLRPALELVCDMVGCSISPLRRLDAVVIESAAFAKTTTNIFQLSFVLKNTAPFEIATPLVEVTLTDRQDQPLIRRVLTHTELGRLDLTMKPGVEWSVSRTISTESVDANSQIAGYRLIAFYP